MTEGIELTFELPGGRRVVALGRPAMTLLEIARRHEVAIEGACGGSMACATCHVHVDERWFDRLEPPSSEEADMLDFAQDLAPTSRLACQLSLRPDLAGLVVRVPRSTLLTG